MCRGSVIVTHESFDEESFSIPWPVKHQRMQGEVGLSLTLMGRMREMT